MNHEVARIVGQIRGSFDPGAWHGPSVRELLAGLTPERAGKKVEHGSHSIWELALHIAAWENAARRLLEGGTGEVPPEANFPAVPEISDRAWRSALDTIETEHSALLDTVGRLSDDELDKPVAGREFSKYFLLHGVVQHNLYHAGQIALLSKLVP
jgi:uncharacterized damage-inducible protein DinB